MKRVFVILIICLAVVACGEQAESLKPLDKGMPNTIALSSGEVVYNMGGEWDAVIDFIAQDITEDIIKITQEGNKFVGIVLNGNLIHEAGVEIIQGELEKNGFKTLNVNTQDGWLPATSTIGKNCNKIDTKTKTKFYGHTLKITLKRK